MRHIYGLFRDADHQLIYVGITRDPARRMYNHRCTTLRGAVGQHYMELFESGEYLTTEDEHFWIDYMASLGCVLKNRHGIRQQKKDRSELETVMNRYRIRPELIAVKCDIPLGSVLLAIKGCPIGAKRTQIINRFFRHKRYKDMGIDFQIKEATQ